MTALLALPAFIPLIHETTPHWARDILHEADEQALDAIVASPSSYGAYLLAMHRLAQLRDVHAVKGVLSKSAYEKKAAGVTAIKKQIEPLREELAKMHEVGLDEEKITRTLREEEASITESVLGYEWRYNLAIQACEAHPEYKAIIQGFDSLEKGLEKKKAGNTKQGKELKRELQKAIIRYGPTSKEVIALRASASAPTTPDAEKDVDKKKLVLDKQMTSLQTRLLGKIKKKNSQGERYFDGSGEFDLEPLYSAHHKRYGEEVQIKLIERAASLRQIDDRSLQLQILMKEKELALASHELDIHNAALDRAKKRAEAARAFVVEFDRQRFDNDFNELVKKRSDQLKAIFVEGSLFLDHLFYTYYDSTRNKWKVLAEISKNKESEVIKKLLSLGATLETESLDGYSDPTLILKLSLSKGVITYAPHSYLKIDGQKTDQIGAYSERGQFRLKGLEPALAASALEELGFFERLLESVPYNLIYRGSQHFGRVLPPYEPLASGREALRFPSGHFITHTLTGAQGKEALARLKMIIPSGGLKSIAERRRMHIKVNSLNPMGDTREGIDMGVPTRIGTSLLYQGSVIFLVKPSVLDRRDMWFAESGGAYEAYAKKIGQGSMHDPCPVSGRQKHLDSGLKGSNETYLRHEISWNEIDTILISKEIYKESLTLFEGWKKEGLVPNEVRIEWFDNSSPKQAKFASEDIAYTWEVDMVTGELRYSEHMPALEEEQVNANGRLLTRALELALL
jgi:hypothetical protein